MALTACSGATQSLRLSPLCQSLPDNTWCRQRHISKEKDFVKAAEAYGNQIAVAPWFPQAYFNRAFLEGEQQQYKLAIADMQTYLKLAPNAQDAREAQDQIYAWQTKAK